MDKQFDVIVVGAGNGGLTAAANTAKAGLKTLLLEKHNIPGGCATSFRRGRFEFEPSLHELCGTTHYVRVTATTPDITVTSATHQFVTADVVMVPPVIVAPVNGETVTTATVLLKWQDTPNNGFRLEWAKSASFPNRSKKIKSVDMGVYEYTLSDLAEGTWYVRIATIKKDDTWTDYSEVVSFDFSPTTAVENVWGNTAKGQCYDLMGRPVKEPQSGQIIIQDGKLIYKQ